MTPRRCFLDCCDCSCSSEDLARAGNRCPRTVPTTEPGPLADLREFRPVRPGFPVALLFVALCLVAGAYVIVELTGQGLTWLR